MQYPLLSTLLYSWSFHFWTLLENRARRREGNKQISTNLLVSENKLLTSKLGISLVFGKYLHAQAKGRWWGMGVAYKAFLLTFLLSVLCLGFRGQRYLVIIYISQSDLNKNELNVCFLNQLCTLEKSSPRFWPWSLFNLSFCLIQRLFSCKWQNHASKYNEKVELIERT